MNKENRQNLIMEIIRKDGMVRISDLIEEIKVTKMTLRRDLDSLEKEGLIVRTHGGAVLADNIKDTLNSDSPDSENSEAEAKGYEPPYAERASEHSDNKSTIAEKAIRLIQNKTYVFLDSGTTTLCIARHLPIDLGCTVITNGVNIAAELLARSFPDVILIGGNIDLNTWSVRGTFSEEQIRQLHADIAFLGCNAISPEGNIMVGNMAEIGLKKSIISISNESYLTADSSKFDEYGLATYASVRNLNGIISDSDLSLPIIEKLQAAGGTIIS